MNQFRVYVIELRPLPGERTRGLGDVYVGSSALLPEERFVHHRNSPKGSRHVKHRGVRLRRDLYSGVPVFSDRETAKTAEKRLARKLEEQGYRVYGACSKRKSPTCVL